MESAITYTLGANLEDLDLSAGGAINGTGNALANLLIGSAGANKLDGKAGADTMQGGLGDDTYVIDNLADQVDENAAANGSDTIQIATAFDLQAPHHCDSRRHRERHAHRHGRDQRQPATAARTT